MTVDRRRNVWIGVGKPRLAKDSDQSWLDQLSPDPETDLHVPNTNPREAGHCVFWKLRAVGFPSTVQNAGASLLTGCVGTDGSTPQNLCFSGLGLDGRQGQVTCCLLHTETAAMGFSNVPLVFGRAAFKVQQISLAGSFGRSETTRVTRSSPATTSKCGQRPCLTQSWSSTRRRQALDALFEAIRRSVGSYALVEAGV